jgi:hypothetical protein
LSLTGIPCTSNVGPGTITVATDILNAVSLTCTPIVTAATPQLAGFQLFHAAGDPAFTLAVTVSNPPPADIGVALALVESPMGSSFTVPSYLTVPAGSTTASVLFGMPTVPGTYVLSVTLNGVTLYQPLAVMF